MAETMRWSLIAGLFVAGWLLSKSHREAVRKCARVLPVAAGMILVGLTLTGWLRLVADPFEIHRWAGQALIIVVWLGIPFAVGVLFQRHFRRRPIASICQLLTLLFLFALVFLAALTGYLGPSHANETGQQIRNVSEETRTRFNILHLFVLPGLCFALLIQWWRLFAPATDDRTRST
jgi:cytochrome bd-type quinol oxidase subunit 2